MECRSKSITVNDFLLAKMMIEENTDKIIIAGDLREKYKEYEQGALGNYSMAFSVQLKKKTWGVLTVNGEMTICISEH